MFTRWKKPAENQQSDGPPDLPIDEMARQLHLDLNTASRLEGAEAVARARARCKECHAAKECEAWLEASFGSPFPPVFCPNAPFFHLSIADARAPKRK